MVLVIQSSWVHSRLRYSFWVSNGKRTFLENFTCLVCLDLYCEKYFGSYLHFILLMEYTDKVILEGIGSSKVSFSFLKGRLGVLSYFLTFGSRNENDKKNESKWSQVFFSQSSFKCAPIEPNMYWIPIAQLHMWHQIWPKIHILTATWKRNVYYKNWKKKIIWMGTWHLYQGARRKTRKNFTIHAQLNSKKWPWCRQIGIFNLGEIPICKPRHLPARASEKIPAVRSKPKFGQPISRDRIWAARLGAMAQCPPSST